MTDIPKEIQDEARALLTEIVGPVRKDAGTARCVNAIARALVARDKRAAEIARGAMEDLREDGYVRTFPASPETIAERILTYDDH